MVVTVLRRRRPPALLHLAVAVILVATACSATRRYEVLAFFFEGVPPPGQTDAATSADEPAGRPVVSPLRLLRASQAKEVFRHQPYAERECTRCHNMYQGGKVRDVPGGLCRSCHMGFAADEPFVHGPVAVDACLECHHPHWSEFPGIVLHVGEELCTRCHAKEGLTRGAHHDSLADPGLACTDCHDPHGGTDRRFLRPPLPEAGN